MAALSYFDAYRSAKLPTNLIQAQRDYFGAHQYERIDQGGNFSYRSGINFHFHLKDFSNEQR